MAKAKTTKISAAQEYAVKHAEAVELLAKLQEMVQDLPSLDGEIVHWGHVGNVGYVTEKLKEVESFLKSIDAVREIAKHKTALN